MASDFSKPVVGDAYATLLPGIVTMFQDLARGLEPTLTGASTNTPTGTIRWNAASNLWERYNGTSWAALAATYAISILGNAATATTAAACSGNAATATTAAACSGNAATASAVAWANVTGAPTNLSSFANGPGYITGITSVNVIGALGFTPYDASNPSGYITVADVKPQIPVRQTVLSGPVDAAGLPAFGGSTGTSTVTASGSLIATAANGFGSSGGVDRVGLIANPSWSGLSTNGVMYLYLDIAANGTCTTGSTALAPVYQWGGTYATTNGKFTFNIQEKVGKVGNGSVATQAYRVFVGQVTVAGGVVTAITWYALMGAYVGAYTATLPAGNTITTVSHNIGCEPMTCSFDVRFTTAQNNYAVNDAPANLMTNFSGVNGPFLPGFNALAAWIVIGNNGLYIYDKTTITGPVSVTPANCKYRFTAIRGW